MLPNAAPKKPTEYVVLTGEVIRTTEKAILVGHPNSVGVSELWIPRSQVHRGAMAAKGDTGPMVAVWFLEKEGIIPKKKYPSVRR